MRHLRRIIPLLVVCALLFLSSCAILPESRYFKPGDELYDINDNLLEQQRMADIRIQKECENSSYTLSDPLVIQNPYGLAPLTALIIFRTEAPTAIDLTINGSAPVRFERSEQHAIPVYGLYDDTDNTVTIADENGMSKTLTISTPLYRGARLDVEVNDTGTDGGIYLVSPDYERTSVFDASGSLLWYLDTADNEGAVIFLGDGRFLISDPYQGTGGIRINYAGFFEMDYLGKIRKMYVGEYGYHHEIVPIEEESAFLLPGHDEDSPFMQAVLYTADAQTMEVIHKIDFYDIFRQIAPDWTDSVTKEKRFNFVINCADYDEESGDALVSVRSLGMIIRINLETAEIKWIFADPANVPEKMQQYLLKPTDDTRFPYGQHAAEFLPDGRISYHNNDVDFFATDLKFADMKEHYSSGEILQIDEDTMKVATVWTYDDGKDVISKMSGSLEFFENGHKLLSYGSAFRKSAYAGQEDLFVTDYRYTEALMEELDENDKVIWRAAFPSIIHQVYRMSFYESGEDAFPNYTVVGFQQIDGQDQNKHAGMPCDIAALSAALKNAEPFDGFCGLMINRFVIECDYEESDEIEVLFISEKNEGRLFAYKKSGEMPPIVNSGRCGVRVAGLTGKQKAYVSISGTWYDTRVVYDFGPY